MDVLLDWQHDHRLNISLLSVIGLWPYGNKFAVRLKRFFASFFVLLYCFSQFATFFTVNYTTRILLRNVPFTIVACGVLIKYISFLVVGTSIKRILEDVNGDRKALSGKEEMRIIKKYVERGKVHTKGFAMLIFPLGLLLVLLPSSSVFLEIVIPLNQTRSRSFPLILELFIDQKKHFFLVTFVYDGMVIVAALVLVSTEAFFIVYIQHACALFEVTSCRIKRLLSVSGVKDSKNSSNFLVIADVVSIHCRAIRYCKSLREELLPSYLILVVLGILSLGAYVLRCIQTFASHEFTDCLTSMMCCIGSLGYMLYINFMVQNVQDSSNDIFDNLYNTAWYKVPIIVRKLILFCMANCIKPIKLDVCSLFAPGYESFSMIVRMTMSYATVLFSFL